jgi:hypothetical protein
VCVKNLKTKGDICEQEARGGVLFSRFLSRQGASTTHTRTEAQDYGRLNLPV